MMTWDILYFMLRNHHVHFTCWDLWFAKREKYIIMCKKSLEYEKGMTEVKIKYMPQESRIHSFNKEMTIDQRFLTWGVCRD